MPLSQVPDEFGASHGVPSATLTLLQVPSPLQVPAMHGFAGTQEYRVPPHIPVVQTSFDVQALPSLQTTPSGLEGFEQTPVEGSHVPVAWHWSVASHTTEFPPAQKPC